MPHQKDRSATGDTFGAGPDTADEHAISLAVSGAFRQFSVASTCQHVVSTITDQARSCESGRKQPKIACKSARETLKRADFGPKVAKFSDATSWPWSRVRKMGPAAPRSSAAAGKSPPTPSPASTAAPASAPPPSPPAANADSSADSRKTVAPGTSRQSAASTPASPRSPPAADSTPQIG